MYQNKPDKACTLLKNSLIIPYHKTSWKRKYLFPLPTNDRYSGWLGLCLWVFSPPPLLPRLRLVHGCSARMLVPTRLRYRGIIRPPHCLSPTPQLPVIIRYWRLPVQRSVPGGWRQQSKNVVRAICSAVCQRRILERMVPCPDPKDPDDGSLAAYRLPSS